MATGAALAPPNVDQLIEDLRALDLLRPAEVSRVLPELEHARARLWLLIHASSQTPRTAPGEPGPELLTVKEVAARLRFSSGHVYEMIRCGHLQGIRDGRAIRVSRAALAEWRNVHEGDRLDARRQHSAEFLVHDDSRIHADPQLLPPDHASVRPGRRPVRRSG